MLLVNLDSKFLQGSNGRITNIVERRPVFFSNCPVFFKCGHLLVLTLARLTSHYLLPQIAYHLVRPLGVQLRVQKQAMLHSPRFEHGLDHRLQAILASIPELRVTRFVRVLRQLAALLQIFDSLLYHGSRLLRFSR